MPDKHALITGVAGFIGSHVAETLVQDGWRVTGIDNFDAYYARPIKESNITWLLRERAFQLRELDIRREREVAGLDDHAYDVIVHLAARPGVRPSIADPVGVQETNVTGTQNLLELAKRLEVPQFVFASSSSVYGVNANVPWSEEDHVLMPISPYASSKVCGELLGHVYAHLYGIRFVALRFFTVYGPRQRPDLAINKFARLIAERKPIPVFGMGQTRRDYTFITDIVAGIKAAVAYRESPYEVINLGNNRTVSLAEMIASLERIMGCRARIDRRPEQPGDVPQTWADISKARRLLGYNPETTFEEGLSRFFAWFCADDRARSVQIQNV